jgi:L-arabinonolactonase
MRWFDIKPEQVVDTHDHVGETPVWSAARGGLFWANCEDPPRLQFWNASTGAVQTWPFTQRFGGFVLAGADQVVIALADGVYDLTLSSGALRKRIANPLEHAALHEIRCDRQGRLWVGSIDRRVGPGNLLPSGGVLFAVRGNTLRPVLEGISCSNGLAFSPAGDRMYHTDSPTQTIMVWDVDKSTGEPANRRKFVTLGSEDGFCDGATVDSEGGYWASLVFNGKLRRYRPDGTADFEIVLPFSNPTNVAFGGPDLATMYITTTRMSIGTPLTGESMHGAVYAFQSGFRGVAEPFASES